MRYKMPANTCRILLYVIITSQFFLLVFFLNQLYTSSHKQRITGTVKRDLCQAERELDIATASTDLIDNRLQRRFKDASENDFEEIETSYNSRSTPARNSDSLKQVRNKIATERALVAEDDRPRLFVAIITARSYLSRRQAIRETWMQECDAERKVTCKFFTDSQDGRGDPIDKETMDQLKEESEKNRGDLILLDSPSGVNFSLRLLAMMQWVTKNVAFDFLLRIDDDHFLCLDRLIEELPYRPRERLYWGHLHCTRGTVRIDEGMLILTADLVNEFLTDKEKLMCHKYGDQAVAMWIYRSMKSRPVTWFGDHRIHHDPPASFIYNFRYRQEICRTYLSLHGSYPREMREFHDIFKKERRNFGSAYDVPPVKDFCAYGRDEFLWRLLRGEFFAKPMPCKDEPIWVTRGNVFGGRNERNMYIQSLRYPESNQKVRIHHIIQNTENKNRSGEVRIVTS